MIEDFLKCFLIYKSLVLMDANSSVWKDCQELVSWRDLICVIILLGLGSNILPEGILHLISSIQKVFKFLNWATIKYQITKRLISWNNVITFRILSFKTIQYATDKTIEKTYLYFYRLIVIERSNQVQILYSFKFLMAMIKMMLKSRQKMRMRSFNNLMKTKLNYNKSSQLNKPITERIKWMQSKTLLKRLSWIINIILREKIVTKVLIHHLHHRAIHRNKINKI